MHLLPCPSCQADIAVSPSQAGDQTTCPQCQASVPIPKLGQLRQLPPAREPDADDPVAGGQVETSGGRRAGFVVLGLVAAASLLIAAFCGIRWSLIDVPNTTEEHIAMFRSEYEKLSAAQLIREYEQMEKYGLDLSAPYDYKKLELTKREWGENASIAGGVSVIALLGACLLALTGRRPTPA